MHRVVLVTLAIILLSGTLAAKEKGHQYLLKEGGICYCEECRERDIILSISTTILDYTYVDQPYDHRGGTDYVSLGGQLTSLDSALGFAITKSKIFFLMTRFGFGVNWAGENSGKKHPLTSFVIVGFGPRLTTEIRVLLINVGAYLSYQYDNGIRFGYSMINGGGAYDDTWAHSLSIEGYGGGEYLVTDNFAIGFKLSLAYYHMWREEEVTSSLTMEDHFNGVNLGLHLSTSVFF